jgi:TetR/AcrR family transcriptional repressor of nem operon
MPAKRNSTETNDTAARILDIGERLVQVRGFNGFSYADVAAELDMTTAALHYHFPGKAELGRALIERYTERFAAALADIDVNIADPPAKLDAYAGLYADVLRGRRMCLCGMLAAEFGTLPEAMRVEMRHFFDENERWLVGVLQKGKREKKLTFTGSAVGVAQSLVGSLEGAMMIARSYSDPARFRMVSERLLAELGA